MVINLWWGSVVAGLLILWMFCLGFVCGRNEDRITFLEKRIDGLRRQIARMLDHDPTARIDEEDE